MSQHHSAARTSRGKPAFVVAGWDRRLSELFVRAYHGASANVDKMHHASDGYSSIDDVHAVLHFLRLTVPQSFAQELVQDLACNAGNRIVSHDFNRGPRVLIADPDSSLRTHVLMRAKRAFIHPALTIARHERLAYTIDDGRDPFGMGGLTLTPEDFELLLEGPCDQKFCQAAFGQEEQRAAA